MSDQPDPQVDCPRCGRTMETRRVERFGDIFHCGTCRRAYQQATALGVPIAALQRVPEYDAA